MASAPVGTSRSTSAPGGVATVAVPSGVQAGDYLVAIVAMPLGTTVSAPGWFSPQTISTPSGIDAFSVAMYTRRAVAGEAASTWTFSGTYQDANGNALVHVDVTAWRGVYSPLYTYQVNTGSQNVCTAPGMTVAGGSSLVSFFAVGSYSGGGFQTDTASGMYQAGVDNSTSGGGWFLEIDQQDNLAAGATGSRTVNILYHGGGTGLPNGSGPTNTIGITMELRPAFYESAAVSPSGATQIMRVPSVPIAQITSPAAGSAPLGGPTLTVAWNYSNNLGFAQKSYRVRFMDQALATTYYDSGALPGTAGTLTVDLVAAGINTDMGAIAVRVDVVATDDPAAQGWDAVNFTLQWGVPTCSITAPVDGTEWHVSTPPVVSWSFSSTRGQAQSAYRVRIGTLNGQAFYDSGWVPSSATSHTPTNVILPDSARLFVGVQVKNTQGVPS